jgi:hypothetical protein
VLPLLWLVALLPMLDSPHMPPWGGAGELCMLCMLRVLCMLG